jgi:hypothetical protein
MTLAEAEAVVQQDMDLLDRLWERAAAYVLVRSPAAVTRVNWAGDAVEVWQAGVTPELARMHQDQVREVIGFQAALMHSAIAALRTAIALSFALNHPVYWPAAGQAALQLKAELEKLVASL